MSWAASTLVDIAGAVVGLSLLGRRVYASPLNMGGRMTRSAAFPIPPRDRRAPHRGPVYSSGIDRELTTPTGAAIISSLARGSSRSRPAGSR
jgi:uncharacterized protein (DUF111 family)